MAIPALPQPQHHCPILVRKRGYLSITGQFWSADGVNKRQSTGKHPSTPPACQAWQREYSAIPTKPQRTVAARHHLHSRYSRGRIWHMSDKTTMDCGMCDGYQHNRWPWARPCHKRTQRQDCNLPCKHHSQWPPTGGSNQATKLQVSISQARPSQPAPK